MYQTVDTNLKDTGVLKYEIAPVQEFIFFCHNKGILWSNLSYLYMSFFLFSMFCTLNIRIVLVFYLQLLFFIGQFYIKLLISAIGGNCNVQYFVE